MWFLVERTGYADEFFFNRAISSNLMLWHTIFIIMTVSTSVIYSMQNMIKHPMYIGVPNMLFNETCTYVECTEKEAVLGYVHRIFVSKRKFYSGQN